MDNQIFKQSKLINEYGQEYWSARTLYKILEYSEYRHFLPVIEKAKVACKGSNQKVSDHIEEVLDMIEIGKGGKRKIDDIHLSRYACYLIIQNADPSKEIVALGQTYFAIQTRKQEVSQQHLEDQKRVNLREEIKHHNKKLFKTAQDTGVDNYGQFYDYGYLGLYGMRKNQIIKTKGLKPKSNILDHMDSEELAANLFRATQAESKIKREKIQGQADASKAHHTVGKKIRQTIQELGGTMPEDIPAVENIKLATKRLKELEHHIEGGEIVISTIKSYPLPTTVKDLIELKKIITDNPGSEIVSLGNGKYKVSNQGLELIEELLG